MEVIVLRYLEVLLLSAQVCILQASQCSKRHHLVFRGFRVQQETNMNFIQATQVLQTSIGCRQAIRVTQTNISYMEATKVPHLLVMDRANMDPIGTRAHTILILITLRCTNVFRLP